MPNHVECNKRRNLGGVKITYVLGYGTLATPLTNFQRKGYQIIAMICFQTFEWDNSRESRPGPLIQSDSQAQMDSARWKTLRGSQRVLIRCRRG
jgi:hypothetical protein